MDSTGASLATPKEPPEISKAEALRQEGNALLDKMDFVGAADKYSQAICKAPGDARLFSNRSLV